MTQSKKKSCPSKSVVESAWDAYFQKEALTHTEDSLREAGWISAYEFGERVGLQRTAAERKAKRDGLTVEYYSVKRHDGVIRRTLFIKLPQLKG
jgi:hypothetical protein